MEGEDSTMSAILTMAPIWVPYAVAAIGAGYAWLSKRWVFLRRVQPLLSVLAKAAVAETEASFVAPTKLRKGPGAKLSTSEQWEAARRASAKVKAALDGLGAGADVIEIEDAVNAAVRALKTPKTEASK